MRTKTLTNNRSKRHRSSRLEDLGDSFRHFRPISFRRFLNLALLIGQRIRRRERVPGLSAVLGKWDWTVDRSARTQLYGKLSVSAEFKALLARVAAGGEASTEELLPYLTLGGREERAGVNALLAEAYAEITTTEHLQQAAIFVRRAWLLSQFSPAVLPLYVEILSATGDTAAVREAFKRAGISAARQGQTGQALQLFDRWLYTYHQFENLDLYDYDFDILNSVCDLAAPHRFAHDPAPAYTPGEEIRIAFLVRGMMEPNSNLVKIALDLVKYRDRSRFDVTIFVPETRASVLASSQGRENIAAFEALGCPVITAPYSRDPEVSLLGLARRITEARSHLMVASAGLADFSHCFVTALRPAPIQVGLVQGPPPLFAPPTLDWCIVWSTHPLLDCPVDCSLVSIYLDWPAGDGVSSYTRRKFDLPDDSRVLLSGGRHVKFQEPEFWQTIVELLSEHPNAYYVAVGLREEEIPFFGAIVPEELRPRIRCLGWREDFLQILSLADVVIDTYPNGGGQVVVQAMSMGIPIVGHRNNYLRPFDQTDWRPAEDFLDDPDLLVPRGNFTRFKQVVSRLIEDDNYRREVGERCRAQHIKQADPAATVRRCEEIYTELVTRHFESVSSRGIAGA